MSRPSLIAILLTTCVMTFAQSKVAITIDDVPNTGIFERDGYQSKLLKELDSLNIPVAIFINEGLVFKGDSLSKNTTLLNDWIARDHITAGNHTFSHSRYSAVGFDAFAEDIEKGELLSKELVFKHDKALRHFRFPYNDLGADSVQHVRMDSLLRVKNYTSTPFTVESSDWMFNYVYEHYLERMEMDKAKEIGELYVSKTLDYFHFFDSLSIHIYSRTIDHIYLCHDNRLNADYLPLLVQELKRANFQFISLDQALEELLYQQKNSYYRKWGVSWFYRWMSSQKERVRWMRKEPDISVIEDLYETLSKKAK